MWGGLTPRERERILHEPKLLDAAFTGHAAAS